MKKCNLKKIVSSILLLWAIINFISVIGTMIQVALCKNRYTYFILFKNKKLVIDEPINKNISAGIAFSEATLDLRQATLLQQTIVLDLFASYCSLRILVPENWVVEENGLVILGEFKNSTKKEALTQKSPILKINHHIRFGQVEVVNS